MNVFLRLFPFIAITFQRCKGKSQLSNDLGIRYGLSKIFLSLRVKEYLAEFVPQLPTVYRHRQPSEGIVKSKVPNGKEQIAPNQKGKKLNFKTFKHYDLFKFYRQSC